MLFGFWHPYNFHFIGNVFYYSCFHFFLNGLNIFCRLQKYWYKLYITSNHSIINALKFVHQWRSVFCIYQLFYHSLSFTDDVYSLFRADCSPVSVTVSKVYYSNAYHSYMALISLVLPYFLTNYIHHDSSTSIFEYRIAHAQLNTTWVN